LLALSTVTLLWPCWTVPRWTTALLSKSPLPSANGIPAIGVRTDFRTCGENSESIVNAMVEGACRTVVRGRVELVEELLQMTSRD